GLLEELLVVVLLGDVALKQNMRVGVDEARKNGGVGEIDEFNAGGRSAAGSDAHDFVALDKDEGIGDGGVRFAIDQAAGANGDALRRWRRRLLAAHDAVRGKNYKCKGKKLAAVGWNHGRLQRMATA